MCEYLLLNFIYKEIPTQVFSDEYCELYQNTYFVEDLQVAGSETPVRQPFLNKNSQETPEAYNFIKKETLAQVFSFQFCKVLKYFLFTEPLWTFVSSERRL